MKRDGWQACLPRTPPCPFSPDPLDLRGSCWVLLQDISPYTLLCVHSLVKQHDPFLFSRKFSFFLFDWLVEFIYFSRQNFQTVLELAL